MEIPKKTRRQTKPIGENKEQRTSQSEDEIQIMETDTTPKVVRVKKTAKKMKSKEDEELDRSLRESGFDPNNMAKDEKMQIAQVLLMSKRDAELQNQSFNEDVHTDSEEEKQTSMAFQQALHPNNSQEAAQKPSTSTTALIPTITTSDEEDLYNRDTEDDQSFTQNAPDHSVDPTLLPKKDQRFTQNSSPVVIESVDATLPPDVDYIQQAVHSSQERANAFSQAIHATPEEEEDPIPIEVQRQQEPKPKSSTVKQKKHLNPLKHVDKKQPKIDQFSHVIIADEEQHMEEEIEVINGGNDDQIKSRQDAQKDFTPDQLEELMSDDGSPVKPVKKTKKTFQLSDSDEETQDLFSNQEQQLKDESGQNTEHKSKNETTTSAHNSQDVDDVNDDDQDKPPPDFFDFPPLRRHYRCVKKTPYSKEKTHLYAVDGMCPVEYTKALVQLFTLYQHKLEAIQKLSKNYIPWSMEPVKAGYHLEHTIDARKRGQNYDFIEQEGESVDNAVCVIEDNKQAVAQKPQAKLFSFRSKKVTSKTEETDDQDLDDFLEGFVSKPSDRTRRLTRRKMEPLQKSAEDFEPFPTTSNKRQGQKRKLYTENDDKFCPIDEDSNDFDFQPKGNGKRKQNNGKNVGMKNGKNTTQKTFNRHESNVSTGSVESLKSEDLERLFEPDRPPSRQNEESLDGLTQNSDVLLDSQGQLYPTQFCARLEKRSKTPVQKSTRNFNLKSLEDDNVEYISETSTQSKPRRVSPPVRVQIVNLKPIQKVKTIFQQQTAPYVCHVAPLPKPEEMEVPPSVKQKLLRKVGDLFKLGGSKTPEVITLNKPDRPPAATGHAGGGDVYDLDQSDVGATATQGFQINEILEDDIQQIQVNREGNRTYTRKVGRKRPRTGQDDEQEVIIKKVNLVPCPLCNRQFLQDDIENHAADCNGPVDDDNPEENVQNPPVQPDVQVGQSTPSAKKQTRRRKKQEDDDFIIEDDESEEEQPTRSDLCCYICDKPLKTQKALELHVQKCLDTAKYYQEQMDNAGQDLEPGEIPQPKRTTRSNRNMDISEGYTSGSEEDKTTLKDIIRENNSSSSSEESSYSDEYDWSPAKTPPDYKRTDKENQLPGGWTLEELQNSPIKSFIPIWKQEDNKGFKQQFDKAKQKYQNRLAKGKVKGQKRKVKRKRRGKGKRKSTAQPAKKRQKCVD